MPIDIQRPSDGDTKKPRLSRIGMISVGLALLLIIAVVAMIASNRNQAKIAAERAQIIDIAVEHATAVCRGVVSASGSASDTGRLNDTIARIAAEKDPLARADMAIDMIGGCLSLAGDNQSYIDELNGARNRVLVAVREYKAG